MIYLASPYSHPDPEVRRDRFLAVCSAAARLIYNGHRVFSPVAHSHPIAMTGHVDAMAHKLWLDWSLDMLGRCDVLWVLKIPGWDQSKGVCMEIEAAMKAGKQVEYVAPGYDF